MDKESLAAFLDDLGVPGDVCWRTFYSLLFDPSFKLLPLDDDGNHSGSVKPLLELAADTARRGDFSQNALADIMRQYNNTCFDIYNGLLMDALQELERMNGEFRGIMLNRHKRVEALSAGTIETVASEKSIEEKIRIIQQKFKTTLALFRKDIVRLDRMSSTDHLTGLYNRRFFDEQIEKEVDQAIREKTWLHLLMIDIDNFKVFNDTYGHLIGDQALKTVAKNIIEVCRKRSKDLGLLFLPARYGGEEFSVIIPAVDSNTAGETAHEIKESISNYTFVIRGKGGWIKHENIKLTVSIGIAGIDHKFTREECIRCLIDSSDKALLKAKRMGKNRIVYKE